LATIFTLINAMRKFLGSFNFAAFASFCLKAQSFSPVWSFMRDGIEQQLLENNPATPITNEQHEGELLTRPLLGAMPRATIPQQA